jgi:hypothetical protein
MTEEQFSHEKTYQAALAIARAMHQQGIIDDGDLDKIERVLRIRFCPFIGAFQGANP